MRRLLVLLFVILATLPIAVYAEPSLADLGSAAQDTGVSSRTSGSGSTALEQTNEMLQGLSSVTDMSEQNETVGKIVSPVQKIIVIIVQTLCYILTLGLTLRFTCDLTYILLPFSRGILAPGGMPPTQGAAGGMDPMGGMGDMGGYGMGGDYGMGGYGMGGGYAPRRRSTGRGRRNGGAGGFSLVSETAVMAVQSGESPLKIYAKDMLIVVVATPILLVLLLTGTLADLGFTIGAALSSFIGQAGLFIGV